ncbi:hypothetical protein ACFQ7B_07660 [Streptomyces erythrochromogenes]|uniref:hypothetical protein n=1 Tax=Streptomyces erythrochromogenes TaxID=285574 RepID=UPI00369E570E
MSASVTLRCDTVWRYSACTGAITVYSSTTAEARAAARAAGWRTHSGDIDYCPGCSGSQPRSSRATVTRLSRPPRQRQPQP